ncbi:MAG: hypothetical protein ACYSTZ_04085, partial [Planctomycetota bacterium]
RGKGRADLVPRFAQSVFEKLGRLGENSHKLYPRSYDSFAQPVSQIFVRNSSVFGLARFSRAELRRRPEGQILCRPPGNLNFFPFSGKSHFFL